MLPLLCCGTSAEEDACLSDCVEWHDKCGFYCLADDCEKGEIGSYCDAHCLEDEGGDPEDCEECFECLEQNHGIRQEDGVMLDYCVVEEDPNSIFMLAAPGFEIETGEPCSELCTACD